MSEPMTKQRPTIDLDDFERRMRNGSTRQRDDDPLAELARLVGEQPDPYDDVFAREPQPAAHDAAYREPAYHEPAYQDGSGRREPGFAEMPHSPRLSGDFASIEAGLRGSLPTHGDAGPMAAGPSFAASDYDAHHGAEQGYEQPGYAEPHAYDQAWQEPGRPGVASRSRRPIYMMAATIAVGVIGIGTAFALKGHIATSPREVKTILADASPTKVQPPSDTASDPQANQDAAILGKAQPAPTTLVNHEEQPVDLGQAVQDNVARDALARPKSDAASVPVPPSPGQMQTAMADPTGAQPDAIGSMQGVGLSDLPPPKRVRVVSVSPDGRILPDDRPPAAAMPASRQPAGKSGDKAAPVAKASTPKAALPKSTSRVTTPKTVESIAGGDGPADALAKAGKKAKPLRVASNEPETAEATDAVSPKASGTGGFAVQLAAPGSEADARSTSSRLAKKFAGALGGRHLGFHKAESNGHSVYRVRVGSLSKPDAVSLCEKLKADGGSCFIAKN